MLGIAHQNPDLVGIAHSTDTTMNNFSEVKSDSYILSKG